MMASIPNMRGTPLPVPGANAAATETAPGDFAAQLPIARGKAVPLVTPEPQQADEGAELVVPDIAEAIAADEGETPEAKTETPDPGVTAKPQTAEVVIPFLQTPPATLVPQVQAPLSAEEAASAPQAPVVQAPLGRRGRPTCEPGDGKTAHSLPTITDAPAAKADASKTEAPQVETQQIEAAVKELLQRKQGLAKPVVVAPTAKPATSETAPVEAKGQVQPQAQTPSAPAAIQSTTPIIQTMAEQPQPALAPVAAQPAVAKGNATGTVEATRTSDLAVERQLDLARGSEWLERLARDIARAGASDTPLRFRLHPQTLGHLQVELQQGDHGTAVRLTVETETARQLLADAQPRLAAEARAQGVRIAETHVDLTGSGRHAPGDQRRQDDARPSNMIRTARGPGEDAVASARSPRRARLDRFA